MCPHCLGSIFKHPHIPTYFRVCARVFFYLSIFHFSSTVQYLPTTERSRPFYSQHILVDSPAQMGDLKEIYFLLWGFLFDSSITKIRSILQ